MLSEPNIDSAVRKGDIYATLIENHANSGNYKVALGILQEMKSKIPKVGVRILRNSFFKALNVLAESNMFVSCFIFLLKQRYFIELELFFWWNLKIT